MYRLKDNVDFRFVNKKSIMNFDFDLEPYYNKEIREIKTPESYIEFSCMGQVFIDFLLPLDLVEEVKDSDIK